jgi:H+-transporting ATPase
MHIMALVVLDHLPRLSAATAIMIVIMSLLDDVPIATIAYDNTPVAERPIRWHMPHLLGWRRRLFRWCNLRLAADRHGGAVRPSEQRLSGCSIGQLQSVIFLQLVAGGRLLCSSPYRQLVLRAADPARLLVIAITDPDPGVLMCGFGWLFRPYRGR